MIKGNTTQSTTDGSARNLLALVPCGYISRHISLKASLTRNGLQEKIFAAVVKILTERGLILKKGTIVDSTFIESPSSTKNKEKKRDPEAHSAKKGNTWHFGYKSHIGVDEENGLVHTVKTTSANEHDVTVMSELLHGEEDRAYGDSVYIGANK